MPAASASAEAPDRRERQECVPGMGPRSFYASVMFAERLHLAAGIGDDRDVASLRRGLLAFALLLCVGCAGLDLREARKGPLHSSESSAPPALFIPSTVGETRFTEARVVLPDGTEKLEHAVSRVSAVEQRDGRLVITEDGRREGGDQTLPSGWVEEYAVAPEGLLKRSRRQSSTEWSEFMLELPSSLTPGYAWTIETPKFTAHRELVGQLAVEAAGQRREGCWRIRGRAEYRGSAPEPYTYVTCPGVGVVQHEYRGADGRVRTSRLLGFFATAGIDLQVLHRLAPGTSRLVETNIVAPDGTRTSERRRSKILGAVIRDGREWMQQRSGLEGEPLAPSGVLLRVDTDGTFVISPEDAKRAFRLFPPGLRLGSKWESRWEGTSKEAGWKDVSEVVAVETARIGKTELVGCLRIKGNTVTDGSTEARSNEYLTCPHVGAVWQRSRDRAGNDRETTLVAFE